MTTTKGWGGKRDGAGRPPLTMTIRVGQTIYIKTAPDRLVEGKVSGVGKMSFTLDTADYRTITIYTEEI